MVAAPRKSLEPYLYDSVEFFEHQAEGVRILARLPHFLLADDMGLGKSLQALTVFAIDVVLGRAKTMLVVCPVSLRANWEEEIKKFTAFPVLLLGQTPHPSRPGRFKILTGRERSVQLKDFLDIPGARIVVCNYEQVIAHQYELNGFDFLVCDEAHLIKNPESKRSQAILKLRRKRTGLMTGTPLLNQVNELWPILHMIDPRRWPDYRRFINRYAVFGGYEGRKIVGAKNVKELNEALAQVMLRRLKSEVLTLPLPRIMQIKVDLHPEQRKLYDELEDTLSLPDANGNPQDIDNALVKFLRLKQICGSSALVDGYADYSYKLDCAIEKGLEVLANGEKVVFFTQFRKILQLIVDRLNQHGVNPIGQLHGEIPTSERQHVVKAWSDYPSPAPLVCMLQVAGVGLNMVAARTAIFVDKLFVPGLNNQAIDRLHRIGQQETQPVEIYEIIARGTIEARIEQILKTKVKTSHELIEESVAFQAILRQLAATGGI